MSNSSPIPVPKAKHHRGKLVVAVNLVCSCLFNVEHLSPKGQYGLGTGISSLNRRAAGAVSLNDEYLGLGRISGNAVGQLFGLLNLLPPCFLVGSLAFCAASRAAEAAMAFETMILAGLGFSSRYSASFFTHHGRNHREPMEVLPKQPWSVPQTERRSA